MLSFLVCYKVPRFLVRLLQLTMRLTPKLLTLGDNVLTNEEAEKPNGAIKASITCDLNTPESSVKMILWNEGGNWHASEFGIKGKPAKDNENVPISWSCQASCLVGCHGRSSLEKEGRNMVALSCNSDHFKAFDGVVYSQYYGERASSALFTVLKWAVQRREFTWQQKVSNIFNANEAGISCNMQPDETFKGNYCHGSKWNKELKRPQKPLCPHE